MLSSDNSRQYEDQDIHTFLSWLDTPGYRAQRRFLEAHLSLATPGSKVSISNYSAQHAEQLEQEHTLHEYLEVLDEVYRRSGTVDAVREAYVDKYGGFVLDLPEWLIAARQQLDSYSEVEDFERTTPYLPLLHQVIARAQEDTSVAPETLAELQNNLGLAVSKDGHPKERIQAHQAALLIKMLRQYVHPILFLLNLPCSNSVWVMLTANIFSARSRRIRKRPSLTTCLHYKYLQRKLFPSHTPRSRTA